MTDRELIAKLTEALEKVWHNEANRLSGESIVTIRDALALARQHNGGWRHLDNEQPEPYQLALVWTGELPYIIDRFSTAGIFRGYPDARWWMPLPTPPKE